MASTSVFFSLSALLLPLGKYYMQRSTHSVISTHGTYFLAQSLASLIVTGHTSSRTGFGPPCSWNGGQSAQHDDAAPHVTRPLERASGAKLKMSPESCPWRQQWLVQHMVGLHKHSGTGTHQTNRVLSLVVAHTVSTCLHANGALGEFLVPLGSCPIHQPEFAILCLQADGHGTRYLPPRYRACQAVTSILAVA